MIPLKHLHVVLIYLAVINGYQRMVNVPKGCALLPGHYIEVIE